MVKVMGVMSVRAMSGESSESMVDGRWWMGGGGWTMMRVVSGGDDAWVRLMSSGSNE